jgi:superfamily II DNA or RNA helicase
MTTNALRLPDPNQLVYVRGRHWVVSEVRRSTLGDREPQHVVDLVSVDDLGLGDELTVVWEVEPGARVLDRETFPTPSADSFDRPDRLDAFLDALRWSAVTSADSRTLQSPWRSGIAIEDYQLDPLVKALDMPRVNLLVADDVGLGKTIETGLVIQELILRHRVRTVLVVCPASLCLKWKQEMAEKFGLEFRIVDAELIRTLRRERGLSASPWQHFPRLITSMDWLKAPRPMSLMREVLSQYSPYTYPRAFDLLVIDEVHNVAPSGRGKYATDSLRTKAIREIAPHFEHRIYLSATPHNGYSESWQALLELLDPQRFARGVDPPDDHLRRVMIRRLKSDLRDDPNLRRPDGSPRFADRHIHELDVDYPDDERHAHATLTKYRRARSQGADRANDFVTLLLKKRFFSSPLAFAKTLEAHIRTLEKAPARSRDAARQLELAIARVDDETADEAELAEAEEDALAVAAAATGPLDARSRALLDELRSWSDGNQNRADAKAQRLIRYLDETCRPGAAWKDERVIVFTEYRDTQDYLYDLLGRHLPERDLRDRVALLYGGMDTVRRERVKDEFQAHPSRSTVRILLATDAASEGIDLQRHCHRLVHYDVPFNPAKMEQRNGRVDRHGQQAREVLIHHFVGAGFREQADTIENDLEFLYRVAQKMNQQREDLGRVAPLLGDEIERKLLGDHKASVEVSPRRAGRERQRLKKLELDLRARLAELAEKVDDSRNELGISPDAVLRVVNTALELARQAPLVSLGGSRYKVGRLTGSWARTIIDLPDRLSGEPRPITFDHETAEDTDDVVLAHLNHPLVAQSIRLLRGSIWSTSDDSLSRVTARIVPDAALGELVVAVHARLVVTGGRGARLHEEVIEAGGRLASGRFSRQSYGPERLQSLLRASTEEPAPPHVREQLADAWPAIESPLQQALGLRAADRVESLTRRLLARLDDETATMRAVLIDLQRSIFETLRTLAAPEQLTLGFDKAERDQFDRDVDALRARAKSVPQEIEREEQAIRARYADPKTWMFPAAVTFLVPRRLSEHGLRDTLGI